MDYWLLTQTKKWMKCFCWSATKFESIIKFLVSVCTVLRKYQNSIQQLHIYSHIFGTSVRNKTVFLFVLTHLHTARDTCHFWYLTHRLVQSRRKKRKKIRRKKMLIFLPKKQLFIYFSVRWCDPHSGRICRILYCPFYCSYVSYVLLRIAIKLWKLTK